jgi:TatD DNase family protein
MSGPCLDAHCHLADPRFAPHVEAALARAAERGITGFLQGGVDPADWARQRDLAARFPGRIFPVFGLHPWWVAAQSDSAIDVGLGRLESELEDAVALGELGLDHGPRVSPESHARQDRAFRAQLDLAYARGVPLVLHILRAHAPALAELERRGRPPAGGLVHSYSGSAAEAARYRELGLLISVGGPLVRGVAAADAARKPLGKLAEIVVSMPGEFLVLETDAPDQPPPSHAGPDGVLGGLNEPLTLEAVARAAGALRGEPAEAILARSRENLRRVFPRIQEIEARGAATGSA